MDYTEFLKAIKNPEKETLELKSNFTQWDEIAETIAAFSTKRGGMIFVGVDRSGVPIGTTCNNEIKGRLHSLAQKEITPCAVISVEVVTHDAQKETVVVAIHVQKGSGGIWI